jgi:ABC-2 type transport system permease protein
VIQVLRGNYNTWVYAQREYILNEYRKYLKSAWMSALEKTNGGVVYLMPEIVIRIITLIALLNLWRVVMSSGVEVGMTITQMLSYTYLSAILSKMLDVKTAAVGWLSEGVIMKLYGRPLSVLGQLIAETVGGWLPSLLLFSLPVAAASPLFNINLTPATPLFFLSLFLCVSLGFAVDVFFACLSIKLRNMNWLIGRIRAAITSLLSGSIIPISLLPAGAETFFRLQPFASLGGAPLSIFVGSTDAGKTVFVQIIWNLTLWPLALLAFHLSQEGMVSYGG